MSSHSQTSRLYLNRSLAVDSLVLDEREARYLTTVLRLKPGSQIRVFNGRGEERHAQIAHIGKRQTELRLLDRQPPLPESGLQLTLVQALPKRDAMDTIVQKATELGVHRIMPVITEFSVPRLTPDRARRRLEHWQRVAQSACEQCGRHVPTRISPVTALAECLIALPETGLRLALDTEANTSFHPDPTPASEVFVLIGPEGGFGSEDQVHIRACRFQPLRLGPRTLRADTAAIMACGLLQCLWGDTSGLPAATNTPEY